MTSTRSRSLLVRSLQRWWQGVGRPASPRRQARPHLEELERRETPSGSPLPVRSPNTANLGSSPTSFAEVGGLLFFAANDGSHGIELWKSDGTSAGTALVSDIRPGSATSAIYDLTNVAGMLFFRANDGSHGAELWKSNGSSTGTTAAAPVRQPARRHSAHHLPRFRPPPRLRQCRDHRGHRPARHRPQLPADLSLPPGGRAAPRRRGPHGDRSPRRRLGREAPPRDRAGRHHPPDGRRPCPARRPTAPGPRPARPAGRPHRRVDPGREGGGGAGRGPAPARRRPQHGLLGDVGRQRHGDGAGGPHRAGDALWKSAEVRGWPSST